MLNDDIPADSIYFVDSHHGIYIPQVFIENVDRVGWILQNVDQYDLDVVVEGPKHEEYWQSWEEIVNKGSVLMEKGEYIIYEDEDLFLVPA